MSSRRTLMGSSARVRRLAAAAAAGAACVLPLLALEMALGEHAAAPLPIALFAFLWLLAGVALLAAWAVARRWRARTGGVGGVHALVAAWPAVAVCLLTAGMWIVLVRDQMPCFLGVPNCD